MQPILQHSASSPKKISPTNVFALGYTMYQEHLYVHAHTFTHPVKRWLMFRPVQDKTEWQPKAELLQFSMALPTPCWCFVSLIGAGPLSMVERITNQSSFVISCHVFFSTEGNVSVPFSINGRLLGENGYGTGPFSRCHCSFFTKDALKLSRSKEESQLLQNITN